MQMVPFEEALDRVVKLAAPLGMQRLHLSQVAGRVLAQDVLARSNAPVFDVSAMDGYGVRDADVIDLPVKLDVVTESFAGSKPQNGFQGGGCIRIFTGAPVPPGIDRVIIQEHVERVGDKAHFSQALKAGRNIRRAGSDFMTGDCLLPKATVLNWRAMTTAAAADQAELQVFTKPKVVILATGDELAEPGQAHKTMGHIPESVSFGIAAFVQNLGAELLRSERLTDSLDALTLAAKKSLEDADVVIVTGGASVGEKDYARSMFGIDALDYVFPKVAIKPGKPVWMAKAQSNGQTKIILGLPGNPTSALVTARLFLAPLLAGLTGRDASMSCQFRDVICADPLPAIRNRETFSRAYLEDGQVVLFSSQDSSSQASLARADILIRRPANSPALPSGSMVQVLDF